MSLIYFLSFQLNDTNSSNIIPNDNKPQEGNKYSYLLILDLIIFGILTYITYISSKKFSAEQENQDGFRPKFIKWLVLANGVRSISLIFIILFGNPNGDDGISWLNSVLHVFPAFLFVSSYMYLATFLADTYYSNIEYNNLLMKPFLHVIVKGGYLFLGLIALVTLIFKGYRAFYYISEFLMALLYLVLGSVTIYFGRKVTLIFQNKKHNLFDSSNEMKNKLTILSHSIGGLFLLKGLSGILAGGTIIDPTKNPNIYDFFWFLILEVAPTLIFILVGRKKETNIAETPRQSSIYEMEYTGSNVPPDSPRLSSYRPPFKK